MDLEQMIMMVGATIAGTFFAFSISPVSPLKMKVYTGLAIGGFGLIVFGFIRLSM